MSFNETAELQKCTFASIWFWFRDRSLLLLFCVALFCGLSPATCTTSFCYLFLLALYLFSTKKEKFLSLNICSLVKAVRTEKKWKHECSESNEAAKLKCDEFNVVEEAFQQDQNQRWWSFNISWGVKITGNFHIFVRLFYSSAHTSSHERTVLTLFTHILRLSHHPPAQSLYGYFHFIIIHRYKYFSIKRIKSKCEENEKP